MNLFYGTRSTQRYLRYAYLSAAAIFFFLTYVLLGSIDSYPNSRLVWGLLYCDVVLVLLACFFIYKKVQRIFRFQCMRNESKRFRNHVITLFSCIAIFPAICVFVFSIVFFNIGIENLFKTPIKDVMDNAEQVAGTYIDDMKLNMKNFVVGLGSQIGSCISGISFDREKMGKILEEETTSLKVEAVLLQVIDKNAVNIVAKTPFSLSIQFEELPEDILYLSDGGVVAWESGDLVISAIVINRDFGLYLIASTLIDEIILDHKHKIKTGVMEYTNLETQRAGLKLSFITFFSVITILLLSLSVLAGVIFANWVLRPVNKLIVATRNVTSGNYDTPIRALKSKNEFDVLISTFNDMMSKLEQQKQQLIISNKQNAWRDIARKIAHEIKNPLTPIQLSAERLKSKYKNEITTTPDVFNTCIDTIIRQVQCIGNLVKEFSDFARMPAPQVTDTDIVKLIKESVFIQANTHKHIRFQQTYAQSEFICKIDPSQMNQVMMNILQNAINSIIEAKEGKNETVGNVSVSFHVKDGAMHLLIEDDGPGFSDASIKKAIDPYYTTREMGTGLGLAIVHKIITDHSGKIILERSKIFGGAKVIIQIPIN